MRIALEVGLARAGIALGASRAHRKQTTANPRTKNLEFQALENSPVHGEFPRSPDSEILSLRIVGSQIDPGPPDHARLGGTSASSRPLGSLPGNIYNLHLGLINPSH